MMSNRRSFVRQATRDLMVDTNRFLIETVDAKIHEAARELARLPSDGQYTDDIVVIATHVRMLGRVRYELEQANSAIVGFNVLVTERAELGLPDKDGAFGGFKRPPYGRPDEE